MTNTPALDPMRSRRLKRRAHFLPLPLLALSLVSVQAADSTWIKLVNGDADGAWNELANWSGGIPDGTGVIADFSTLDITSLSTVSLGSAVTAGKLIFGDMATATAGSWTLDNGGVAARTLTLAGATPTITVNALGGTTSTVTISAAIAGSGGLTKDGTGTVTTGVLVLSGPNTYSGATNINTGTIRAQNSLAFGGVEGERANTNVVNVADGARLQLQGGTSIANAVNINGTNALNINSSGSSTLSGTVTLQSNSSVTQNTNGNNHLYFSGTVALGGYTLTMSPSGQNNNMTISGKVTGNSSSGITKSGVGTLTLNGNGTEYSGTTTLLSSALVLGNDTVLGTGVLAISPANNGSATVRSSDITTRNIAAVVTLPSSTNNGNASGKFIFGSTNSSVNGGLTFTNTTEISMGSATRTLEVHNRTQFDAGLSGSGGITMQTGTGTLVLNGTNTYAGATTINAGTLLVNGSLASGSAVAINANGTLGGTGTIGGATTILGKLSPGDSNDPSILSFGSSLTLASTALTLLDIAQSEFDSINVTGALIYGGALTVTFDSVTPTVGQSWQLFTFGTQDGLFDSLTVAGTEFIATTGGFTGNVGGVDYTFSYENGTLAASAIPEPSTYATIAGALILGVVVVRRCRRALAEAQA